MKNITELVFILDKSGSMAGLESDTIGGFNSMITKQKNEEGEALVSTVLFANSSQVIHDRVSIQKIKKLTEKDYCVGGCTALLDAVGNAIKHIEMVHRYIRKEDIPSNVLFVITTDGMENASRKYNVNQIKQMIEKQKKIGWKFIFMGANIDAIDTASTLGISEDCAVNYISDGDGTELNYTVMSDAICELRTAGCLPTGWKKKIDDDYKSRNHLK